MLHIIFDFDGTLVDSSEGILASLCEAFRVADIKPIRSLSSDLIGPPLRQILLSLCDSPSDSTLELLTNAFKSHYDNSGLELTHPFPGIMEMLDALNSASIPLHIATNKRHLPTKRIIENLGWSHLFNQVLSPDSFTPSLASKAQTLAQLLSDCRFNPHQCLYIGDRLDDLLAAEKNNINFALAEWGYDGDPALSGDSIIRFQQPEAIHHYIRGL